MRKVEKEKRVKNYAQVTEGEARMYTREGDGLEVTGVKANGESNLGGATLNPEIHTKIQNKNFPKSIWIALPLFRNKI